MREFGKVLSGKRFIEEAEDIFYLNKFEISQALYDLYDSWGIGSSARGPRYWPEKIVKRKEIMKALQRCQPVPALGVPPEEITEPFTIMLWGVVSEKIKSWLEAMDSGPKKQVSIKGHPASPGIVEGPARIVLSNEDLGELKEGEVMFCPITTPSWTPIFPKIKGIVTNVGGSMSHAAIVAREYDVPAVVGTGMATQLIKTGQRVKLDGTKGSVQVLQ
jgi:pyruvate,water dikinase